MVRFDGANSGVSRMRSLASCSASGGVGTRFLDPDAPLRTAHRQARCGVERDRTGRHRGRGDRGASRSRRPAYEKVARHAYRITDEDVGALRSNGYSEDAIFEVTLAAAIGAGLARMERGLAALDAYAEETSSHAGDP
jgi:hypothetical protein